MSRRKIIITVLLLFNTLTALAGGLGLMTGWLVPPESLIEHTIFINYFLPGLILFGVVGGSSLVALLSASMTDYKQNALVVASGLIMLGWIVGELVITNTFHWLQVIYLVTGIFVVYLAMQKTNSKKAAA